MCDNIKNMTFQLPDLPYAYSALEPFIDEITMQIHHDKHHGVYVEKLNGIIEKHPELLGKSIEELLTNINALPEEAKTPIRNNGGGHYNHTFFWEIMTPGGAKEPQGNMKTALNSTFGDFLKFQENFAQAGMSRFGSGWVWLIYDGKDLEIVSTPNQDNPLMDGKKTILGLDVWEHAYYLKYQQKRADYIAAWWNVVNWDKVEENFQKIVK